MSLVYEISGYSTRLTRIFENGIVIIDYIRIGKEIYYLIKLFLITFLAIDFFVYQKTSYCVQYLVFGGILMCHIVIFIFIYTLKIYMVQYWWRFAWRSLANAPMRSKLWITIRNIIIILVATTAPRTVSTRESPSR